MTFRGLLRAAVSLAVIAAGLAVLDAPAAAATRGPYYYWDIWAAKCIDVPRSNPANNVTMTIYTCRNGATNQQWLEKDTTNGYVQIQNVASGKCLTVLNASPNLNAAIIQYTCNGGTNAQWLPVRVRAGGNYYYLKNRKSGYCIHVKNASLNSGATLLQHECKNNNKGNNEWTWDTEPWN